MDCGAKYLSQCWPRVDTVMVEYLVSKGADVKLDVDPKRNPGYTLLHKAAFHGKTGIVKALLKGGADPNAVYYGEAKRPRTPLMEAARCDFKLSTGDGIGKDSTNSTILALLDAGANPLPQGRDKPLTTFFPVPPEAEKCHKYGACTEAEVKAIASKYFSSSDCPNSWMLAWKAQKKAASAAAAAKPSGRRMLAVAVPSSFI